MKKPLDNQNLREIAHDLNNSLAAIMMNAEFLLSDIPPETEQYIFAENIKKAGQQLQELAVKLKSS